MTTPRLFRINHLPRSGGHLIINWVLAHLDDVTFSNNQRGSRVKRSLVKGTGVAYTVISRESDFDPCAEMWILRDPYNHIASRIAYYDRWRERSPCSFHGETDLDLWTAFASSDRLYTKYNYFVEQSHYRRHLAHEYDLPNPGLQPSIDEVTDEGHGSSFDGKTKRGSEMKVNERYLTYLRDPRFAHVLASDLARTLCQRHFGWHLTPEGKLVCG